ncbi:MAG: hypothetical protein AMXMBFR47_24850 [Planctomycetota bacterium]
MTRFQFAVALSLAVSLAAAQDAPATRPASAPATQAVSTRPAASQPASKPARDYKLNRQAGYKLEPGPYQVGADLKFSIFDKPRGRRVPLIIRYPKGAPKDKLLPLIIFSHGAGGSAAAFPQLSDHWASHGYVVVHPTHSDSLQLRRKEGESLSDIREDPRNLLKTVKPLDRLADIKLILDSIDKIEEHLPALKDAEGNGLIDRKRIGLAGHSAGAYTTQIAIGAKIRGPRARSPLRNLVDDRITAGILISGQGTTNRSFDKDSWADIRRPMMVFAGSLDRSPISDETPESRREPFEFAPPGDKYLVYIDGATHSSYAGKATSRMLGEKPTTDLAVITETVSAATTAFWDLYLKQDLDARKYLHSAELTTLSDGAAEYKRK